MPAISAGLAIGLGALSAGTSVVGGVLAKKGQDAQAKAAENAAAAGVAEQRRQYDLSRQDLAPWISTGGQAIQQLGWLLGLSPQAAGTTASGGSIDPVRRGTSSLFPTEADTLSGQGGTAARRFTNLAGAPGATPAGFDPATFGSLNKDFTLADFQKDPGYDFMMAEGQKAIDRSASARGGLFSGRTMKETSRYAQNYSWGKLGEAYNRFEANRAARYNRLSGVAGMGQTSANQMAVTGAQTSASIADTMIGGATSAAASRASGANALAQGISGGINSGLNWYLLSQLQKKSGNTGSRGWV